MKERQDKAKPRLVQAPVSKAAPPEPFCPIVGFGASAGGLEAFQEVLDHLPPDTGLVFAFVQHLDPKHGSMLVDLLAKHTRMAVVQVSKGLAVQPNHVYVIPPNAGMQIAAGKLLLTERQGPGVHLPIDEFFKSLAEQYGSRAIAVLLSGTASDGTQGMKAVKAVGGITLVQDQTAKYDAMPRNAAAAGHVDMVLPPAGIAQEILRLCRHPYVLAEQSEPEESTDTRTNAGRFNEIFAMLRASSGVDFSLYKHGTLQRRIFRRMALNRLENEAQYVKFLRENAEEQKALFQDLLISVTGFFREPATFEGLKRHVFPAIFQGRPSHSAVRIWVPGCSSGEDTYSVAISLLEFMRDSEMVPVQIFGTDLNEPALARARAGIYPESVASELTAERLRRFFVRVDGHYQVSRTVRDMCIFAQQNLVKDPPFSKLDLVVCRNVLIYLGSALQSKVMRFFHYALKGSGFLVLGLSETAGSGDLFLPIDRRLKIYTRRAVATRVDGFDFGAYDELRPPSDEKKPAQLPVTDLQRRVDQYILGRYSPAGVLIEAQGNILQFHGHTGPYLQHGAGEPVLNINPMIRPDLVVSFRRVLERARKRHSPARGEPIRFTHLEQSYNVRISVTPMALPGNPDGQFLVLFEEIPEAPEVKPQAERGAEGATSRLQEVEDELQSTRQYLEAVIEEQQATTEELKSANEEVQSSNEELQSTNEELLTAKEELQSTNEELTTVNEEMHTRNAELGQINNDLNNLLTSVNIPIVMLGNDLSIRRFTPQAEKVLHLLPTDVGRPLSDFRPKIDLPDLENLLVDVIQNLRVKEREVQDREGRWYTLWIRPYRTAENRIDGAVMVLVDITDRKVAAEARYRRLFEAAKDAIMLADAESGEIIDVNPYMSKIFSFPRAGSVGVKYWELDVFRNTELNVKSLEELHENEFIQRAFSVTTRTGEWLDLEIVGNIYHEAERRVIQFNIRDVTERKRVEEIARRAHVEMEKSQDVETMGRLTSGLANDFSDVLTAIVGYTKLAQKQIDPTDPVASDLEQVARAAARAKRLTRQLLALGRRLPLDVEIVNLNELIRELEHVVRDSVPVGVQVTINLAADLSSVNADIGQMQQLVLNLVLNARDALPGAGTLKISTTNIIVDEDYSAVHPAVPPGAYAMLEISDSRAAMEAGTETQAGLMGPFLGTEQGRSAASHGFSLYSAVRLLGGHLWAASELGRGNTYRIFLPQVRAPKKDEAQEADGLLSGSETILLVEDEELVRGLTARILRQCGYTVIEAAKTEEAIQLVKDSARPVDLLLTDVKLAGTNGYVLAQWTEAISPRTRILFMSISPVEDQNEAFSTSNKSALLQKPFTPEILSRRIREIMEE